MEDVSKEPHKLWRGLGTCW